MMPRKRQLELGLRRNRGRTRCPPFVEDMAGRLQRPPASIRRLDLEESDAFWERFTQQFVPDVRSRGDFVEFAWPVAELNEVQRAVRMLNDALPDENVIVFRALWTICGAVESTSREIFESAFRLVDLNGEELIAVSHDMATAVVLGFNTDWFPSGPVDLYQLTAYGQRWSMLLRQYSKR